MQDCVQYTRTVDQLLARIVPACSSRCATCTRSATSCVCRCVPVFANTELRCDRAVDSLILSADAASSMLLPFDRQRARRASAGVS
jgi:hypothetical protein